jgi:hypothetical protein
MNLARSCGLECLHQCQHLKLYNFSSSFSISSSNIYEVNEVSRDRYNLILKRFMDLTIKFQSDLA